MSIAESEIVRLSRPKLNALESVYLPEIKTSRTIQYPEQRREHMPVTEGGPGRRRTSGACTASTATRTAASAASRA
jgi:hypothetical protein